MSIRSEQCSHFAVPSSDTSVELARPQFRHFQGRSDLSMRRIAFSPMTETGDASCEIAVVVRRGNRGQSGYHARCRRAVPTGSLCDMVHSF